MKKHFEKLKNFDAYYKPVDDLQERTFIGGTVSLLCWMTILFLSTLRTYEFLTSSDTKESIYVDSSRSSRLWINLDFVFQRISCDYLALDAMDSSGEQHLHIDHNIFKRRLDLNGNPIDEPKNENIGSNVLIEEDKAPNNTSQPKCGSCYGAEDPIRNITCCNTCEEVKDAYRHKKWEVQESKIEQCKSSATSQQIQKAFKEGCQIYGYMEVNRVAGSFHVAPGQSFSINHVHVHDVQPFSSRQFNTSHHIRHLSFGKNKVLGNVNINPLDGSQSAAAEGGMMYHYYIKIVPTLYVNSKGELLETNQFSVTKYEKVTSRMSGESGMPGVFFSYELSALMVKITDRAVPISHLITDLCSIVGGVWIVSMFIDSVCYRSSKLLSKMELGKVS